MTRIPRTWWILGGLVLMVSAALPFVGWSFRADPDDHCALDGQRVEPRLRVRLDVGPGDSRQFCSLHCAEVWLQVSGVGPVRIRVTDEATGSEIDFEDALFVRSSVVAQQVVGERRHVFRDESAAQAHVKAFHGRLLSGKDRPFTALIER